MSRKNGQLWRYPLERRADVNSRRSHRIYLTKKGREPGPKLFAVSSKVNAQFLSSMRKSEQNQVEILLGKLLASRLQPALIVLCQHPAMASVITKPVNQHACTTVFRATPYPGHRTVRLFRLRVGGQKRFFVPLAT